MEQINLENLESCESLYKVPNPFMETPGQTHQIEIPFYGNKITININLDKFIKSNYPINIIINI
jgi:hypothetical protein